jgi:hypothetical protein
MHCVPCSLDSFRALLLYPTDWWLKRKDRVRVPRAIDGLVTSKLLVMEFLDGKSLNDVKKESLDSPEWKRKAFGLQLLDLMAKSWGRMIFGAGLFHGDAHPVRPLRLGRQCIHIDKFTCILTLACAVSLVSMLRGIC